MSEQVDTKYSHYLNNDDLAQNLGAKTLFGVLAVGGGNGVRFIIQIAGTAVLARILFPEDFGLVAMVTAITGFFDVFKDAGLSMATVQREEITHEQISTLFWIISATSLLLMFCIFAASPIVSWFYGDERLIEITLALGVSIFLGGLGIQHRALLRRRMSFGIVATIDMSAQLLVTAIGISLAFWGLGYWALVGMHTLRPLIATLLLWCLCPWRPGLPKRGTGVRKMLAFGGYLSFSRIMTYLVNNLDNILIGSIIGPYALGLYSRAYALVMKPLRQVTLPISNTIMSTFSRLQNDELTYRNYFRKAIHLSTSFTMPIVIFSFVAADEIILLFLGNKWQTAVPIFKAFIPAAFIFTTNGAIGWPLIPLGKTKHFMRISIVTVLTTVLAFSIGINWGSLGMAIALSSRAIITRPFFLWYSFNNSVIKYTDFLTAISRPAASSIFAGICIWYFKPFLIHQNIPLTFLLIFLLYFTFYFIIWTFILNGKHELKTASHNIMIIKQRLSPSKAVHKST